MPRPKERCSQCGADVRLFYTHYVCLDCGESRPKKRRFGFPSNFEDDIKEAMEILRTLHLHHFRKVKSTHAMSIRGMPPGSSETRKGFYATMEERLQQHGELTSKLHFLGRFVEEMQRDLRYTKDQLASTEDALVLNQEYAERWFGKGNV